MSHSDRAEDLVALLTHVRERAYPEKPVVVSLPKTGTGFFIGDLHGDIAALEEILRITNFEERLANNEDVTMIFMGDYVDRGKDSIAVLVRVFRLLLDHPDNVIVLRGNHETDFGFNYFMGFRKEVMTGRNDEEGKILYKNFHETFDYLPLIAYGDTNGIVAMHGALPTEGLVYASMTYLAQILITNQRFKQSVMWSDVVIGGKERRSWKRLFKGHARPVSEVEINLAKVGATFMFRGHSHTIRGCHAVSRSVMTVISANALGHFGKWAEKRGQRGFAEVPLDTPTTSVEQIRVTIF